MTRPYDQLTGDEQAAVDSAFRSLTTDLILYGSPITGDDRAERVIDAIATGILESQGLVYYEDAKLFARPGGGL